MGCPSKFEIYFASFNFDEQKYTFFLVDKSYAFSLSSSEIMTESKVVNSNEPLGLSSGFNSIFNSSILVSIVCYIFIIL